MLARKTASSATLPAKTYLYLVKPNLWCFLGSLLDLANSITHSDDITMHHTITKIINTTQSHIAHSINNTKRTKYI